MLALAQHTWNPPSHAELDSINLALVILNYQLKIPSQKFQQPEASDAASFVAVHTIPGNFNHGKTEKELPAPEN